MRLQQNEKKAILTMPFTDPTTADPRERRETATTNTTRKEKAGNNGG